MRLKRSHKTNPEVVWRRPDLDVYRAATRRRKDVRVSSKYLKISSRNAGDPLLIKTAGSTCAFPGLLRDPPRVYICPLSLLFSSLLLLPDPYREVSVIIFRRSQNSQPAYPSAIVATGWIIGPAGIFFSFSSISRAER